MKKLLLFIAVIAISNTQAQTEVVLRINHLLGASTFALDQATSNNLGNEFKVTRCQYYVSSITVIHDGGTETAIPTDTIAFIDAALGATTEIPLGEVTFTSIEGIKFHVGVQAPENNEDPSLLPAAHPLAPKSPSMHWGWTAGYRFAAFEGMAGTDFAQGVQLHGVGNENYFTTTVMVGGVDESGTTVIDISGDYTQVVFGIDISGGVVSHGAVGEALTSLQNFQNRVFGTEVLSTDKIETIVDWSIFPNPAQGENVSINLGHIGENLMIEVSDINGAVVYTQQVSNNETVQLETMAAGVYVVKVQSDGMLLDTKRLICK